MNSSLCRVETTDLPSLLHAKPTDILEGVSNVIEPKREGEKALRREVFLDALQDFGGYAIEGAVALIKSVSDKCLNKVFSSQE